MTCYSDLSSEYDELLFLTQDLTLASAIMTRDLIQDSILCLGRITVKSHSYLSPAVSRPLTCINLNIQWKMFDLKHMLMILTRFATYSTNFQWIAILIACYFQSAIGCTVQQQKPKQLPASTL